MIYYKNFYLGIAVAVWCMLPSLISGLGISAQQLPGNNENVTFPPNPEWEILYEETNSTSMFEDYKNNDTNLETVSQKLNESDLYECITRKGNITERSFIYLPGRRIKRPFINFYTDRKDSSIHSVRQGPLAPILTFPSGQVVRYYSNKSKKKKQKISNHIVAPTTIRYDRTSASYHRKYYYSSNRTYENSNKMENMTKKVNVANQIINQQYLRERSKLKYVPPSNYYHNVKSKIKTTKKVYQNHEPRLGSFKFPECDYEKYYKKRKLDKSPTKPIEDNITKDRKTEDPSLGLITKIFKNRKKVDQTLGKLIDLGIIKGRNLGFLQKFNLPLMGSDNQSFDKNGESNPQRVSILKTELFDPRMGHLTPNGLALVNMHHIQHAPLASLPGINQKSNRVESSQDYDDGNFSRNSEEIKLDNDEWDFQDSNLLQTIAEIERLQYEAEHNNSSIDNKIIPEDSNVGRKTNHNISKLSRIKCVYPNC